jgi:hypothetical protein
MENNQNLPEIPPLGPPAIDRDSLRKVRPWDIFNKNIDKVSEIIQKERMSICKECPQFIKITGQCKECGCFMESKTKLPDAYCPLLKWDYVVVPESSIDFKEER